VLVNGAVFGVTTAAVAFLVTGLDRDAAVPMVAIAAVLTAVSWPLQGRLYDASISRRIRRVVSADIPTERTWSCEVELRKEGVWARDRGVELLLHWRELNTIHLADDALEFHFAGGFVIVRARAFPSPDVRARWVEAARAASGG
jgi:hypothetical protein